MILLFGLRFVLDPHRPLRLTKSISFRQQAYCHTYQPFPMSNLSIVIMVIKCSIYLQTLTLCLLVAPADNFGKQFGPRTGFKIVGTDMAPNCLAYWSYTYNHISKKKILKKKSAYDKYTCKIIQQAKSKVHKLILLKGCRSYINNNSRRQRHN